MNRRGEAGVGHFNFFVQLGSFKYILPSALEIMVTICQMCDASARSSE